MKTGVQAGLLRRVASTRMPTEGGVFQTIGFERRVSHRCVRAQSAHAFVLCLLSESAPLLCLRSQCFSGENVGSLRCDCAGQLRMAMRTTADGGRALVIYECQGGRSIGL